jgi:Tfp pilus assembly major pilin PilA
VNAPGRPSQISGFRIIGISAPLLLCGKLPCRLPTCEPAKRLTRSSFSNPFDRRLTVANSCQDGTNRQAGVGRGEQLGVALGTGFLETAGMKDNSDWQVPKWPFCSAGLVLLATSWYFILRPHNLFGIQQMLVVTGIQTLGGIIGCIPFFLEYNAAKKLVEVNAVVGVAEKLADLEKYSAQIAAATGQWAMVQESTKGNAEKTVTAAKEIAERMATEIKEFNEFQVKLNDTEKSALRLEVDKLRRGEAEWLQVVVRILDHIFALHNAAVRSGQPEVASQVGQFQLACRDAARRVGLTPFVAEPGAAFDAKQHRAHGVENPPTDALVAETLAPGLTFQGRLVRPVLVHLAEKDGAKPNPAEIRAEAEAKLAEKTKELTERNKETPKEPSIEATKEAAEETPVAKNPEPPEADQLPLG